MEEHFPEDFIEIITYQNSMGMHLLVKSRGGRGNNRKKDQEELPTMVLISIPEQGGAASIDFVKNIYLNHV